MDSTHAQSALCPLIGPAVRAPQKIGEEARKNQINQGGNEGGLMDRFQSKLRKAASERRIEQQELEKIIQHLAGAMKSVASPAVTAQDF